MFFSWPAVSLSDLDGAKQTLTADRLLAPALFVSLCCTKQRFACCFSTGSMTKPVTSNKTTNASAEQQEPKSPVLLHKVWDCPKLKKWIDVEGKPWWTCLWCDKPSSGHSATRALAHILGVADVGGTSKIHVGKCPARDNGEMDQTSLIQCQTFLHNLKERNKLKRSHNNQVTNSLGQDVKMLSNVLDLRKHQKTNHAHSGNNNCFSPTPTASISGITDSISSEPQKTREGKQTCLGSSNAGIVQLQERTCHMETGETHAPDAETQLDNCIAKFIFDLGLPFGTCECEHLKLIIKLSKNVSSTYKPPTRNTLVAKHLNLLHGTCKEQAKKRLLDQASVFGLSVLGDGATIKRKPLFNAMMSGIHEPCFVPSVKDCSKDLAKGQDKTGEHICSKFLLDMDIVDPGKKLFDCVMFDGGSNFQKAARLMKLRHPRLNVIHGCEHALDLCFKDIVKIPEIDRLVQMCRLVHNIFGGRRHRPCSVSKSKTQEVLKKELGLLQVAGTRMAGHFCAFVRALKLKTALRHAIEDNNFVKCILSGKNQKLSKKLKKEVTSVIENNCFFDAIKILVKALFLVVKCLRLSDCNKPGMDKICFFLCEARRQLACSANGFNNQHLFNTDEISVQPGDLKEENCDSDITDSLGRVAENDLHSDVERKTCNLDCSTDDSDESSSEDRMKLVRDGTLPCDRRPEECDPETLSRCIFLPFEKRMQTMASDMAVAGWLLSVQPDMFADAKKNMRSIHIKALKRVAKNLLQHEGNTEQNLNGNVTKFMEQWHHFRDKKGIFGDASIWTSSCAKTGQSHFWRQLISHQDCFQLGHVACRVASKGLGIGPCERQWGDAKQMCTGKRSAISSERLEKQAILFGDNSIRKARLKRKQC